MPESCSTSIRLRRARPHHPPTSTGHDADPSCPLGRPLPGDRRPRLSRLNVGTDADDPAHTITPSQTENKDRSKQGRRPHLESAGYTGIVTAGRHVRDTATKAPAGISHVGSVTRCLLGTSSPPPQPGRQFLGHPMISCSRPIPMVVCIRGVCSQDRHTIPGLAIIRSM